MEEFCRMKSDRDILIRIRIKKDGRRVAYASQRISKTDFPVIACCASRKSGKLYVSVGARPAKAELVVLDETQDCLREELAKRASEGFTYGTNMRGSGAYRKHLAEIYIKRLLEALDQEER